jgi:5-dehydro-2-deoxygluconokinase
MKLGYPRPLYLMAFDHRHTFSRGFFGADDPVPAEIQAQIGDLKDLIFQAVRLVVARGAPGEACGVLVDEQFGAAVARRAKSSGAPLAMPVEKSGQAEFQFEYGPDFGRHLEAFAPDFAKVLVRYNPDGDRELNRRQTQRLAQLSDWLHAHQRRYLFELLVPPTTDQLARVGSQDEFDRQLRAGLVVEVMRQLQAGGVEPDIWKIEGLESTADCARVVEQARGGDGREEVVCIVLGRAAPMERCLRWLTLAASVPGFAGFAVGRTLWQEAIGKLVARAQPRERTVLEIADRYERMIDAYREAEQRAMARDETVHGAHPE